ncbi:DNA-binding CsgD family transcriptional regulator [Amaricoccus macauensis]|uniref:DNA-binding CsgD family transcriptional regulator n=1 Tax=Amaricoccus macauensis TaxID=57001 RepID=A0A840SRF4_9RHOB|nr:LuxR C-terminal-related transcriptional regulator [Amaricoccus macauensis]MBB5223098.1 DNA-binding CsgD family transcriptional regulator [Amaricoccus macauensis]
MVAMMGSVPDRSRRSWPALLRHRNLLVLAVVQGLCASWFLFDILMEVGDIWRNPWHQIPEVTAVILLCVGTVLSVRQITSVLRRSDAIEARLQTASQAFRALLEETFDDWGITDAERDVAILTLKGLSISEIAEARGTRPGTVRAQSAAIYRKAGVSNRLQLMSLFMDDLTAGLVLTTPAESDTTR